MKHAFLLFIALMHPISLTPAEYSKELTNEQAGYVLLGGFLTVFALSIVAEKFFNSPQKQLKCELERYQRNANLYQQARILAKEIQTLDPQQLNEALGLENRIITLLLGEITQSTTLPYNTMAWKIKTQINELNQSIIKTDKLLNHEALTAYYEKCRTLKDNLKQLKVELQLLLGILTKQSIYSEEMTRLTSVIGYRETVGCICLTPSTYKCINCHYYKKRPAFNF